MSTVAKRKAQDLVRHGKIQDAIEKMRDLVSEGEADPYDHVYLGDLLMRVGERDDALAAYQQAIRSYEAVGLNRNAIAIAKKVVRTDAARPEVHRSLAQLYEQEGLSTEALPHYLIYLDSFSGEAVPPNEFLETLDQAAALTGTRVEVALRLVEHFHRIRRHRRAAELLEEVADNAMQAGSEDIAIELRQRAMEARHSAETSPERESNDNENASASLEIESAISTSDDGLDLGGAVSLSLGDEPEASLPVLDLTAAEESGTDVGIDASMLDTAPAPFHLDRSAIEDALDGEDSIGPPASRPSKPSESTFEVEHFPVAAKSGSEGKSRSPFDADDDADPAAFEARDAAGFGADAPGFGTSEIVSETAAPAAKKEQVWEIEDPDSSPLALFPESGGRDPEAEAGEAYAAGKWGHARALYERVHHERPSDRHVLARLVEVIRHLHDDPGEVHYLSLLGDAWIAESEYEEALECFLRILQLDPGNGAAQRRLARFRELGIKGAEAIREADSNALLGILEAGRTEVAVKGGDGFRTEDWVELEGLLEEFKSGLKNQMDESDYQAHYDLAVSHHSMGLVGEALEEVDVALACKELPPEVERRARELRGSCLMDLQRYREAVHEFREAAERAGEDHSARRAALYNLGRALEAVEEWQEATETYTRLHLEARGLLDVESRLRHCESQLTKVTGAAFERNRDSSPEADRSETDNAA